MKLRPLARHRPPNSSLPDLDAIFIIPSAAKRHKRLRKNPDPNGLQVLKCRVSVRRHFCHPSSFHGRGCENGRSTEDPASES